MRYIAFLLTAALPMAWASGGNYEKSCTGCRVPSAKDYLTCESCKTSTGVKENRLIPLDDCIGVDPSTNKLTAGKGFTNQCEWTYQDYIVAKCNGVDTDKFDLNSVIANYDGNLACAA